jgi:hypothetical protein
MRLWPNYYHGPRRSLKVLHRNPFRLFTGGALLSSHLTVQGAVLAAQADADARDTEDEDVFIYSLRVDGGLYLRFSVMPRSDVQIRFSEGTPINAFPLGAGAAATGGGVTAAETSNPIDVDAVGATIAGEAGTPVAQPETPTADFYVTKSGLDSWDGTAETFQEPGVGPKLTIGAGLSVMSGGDVLQVGAGTYSAALGNAPSGSAGVGYTVIRAKAGDTVNLTPTGSPGFLRIGTFSNDSYIEVDGFVCTDSANYDAFKIDGSGHHIRIQNCTIANCISKGILDSTASGSTGNCEFLNNHISNVGADTQDHCIYTTSDNNTIWGNTLLNAVGYGLQIFDDSRAPSNNDVRYNFIRDNGRGMVTRGNNNYIANNIIVNNAGPGVNILNYSGMEVYNNTIYGNSGVAISNGGSGTQIKNNIMWQNDGTVSGGTQVTNLTTDPSFVVGSPVNAVDFKLQSGSAARNAGTDLSSPEGITDDFEGEPRPKGSAFDIGAYEFDE